MTLNDIIIRLLTLINNRRHGFSHADYFYVGIISDTVEISEYIIETDTINIKIISDKNIQNFIRYDLIVIIKENEENSIGLQLQPLSYFYTPRYFSLDNSLKAIYITCKKFYIPQEIIYNEKYLYPIENSINILKGEK